MSNSCSAQAPSSLEDFCAALTIYLLNQKWTPDVAGPFYLVSVPAPACDPASIEVFEPPQEHIHRDMIDILIAVNFYLARR
jgi:hypothetical protein